MKANILRFPLTSTVACATLLFVVSAFAAANKQLPVAKKFFKKVPTAELPAKAEAFLALTSAQNRQEAYEAIKILYPTLSIRMPVALAQGAPPTFGEPFQPGGPQGYINRSQTEVVQPGGSRTTSRSN